MNKPNLLLYPLNRKSCTSRLILLTLLCATLMTSACSTTCRRKAETERVLIAQSELLQKLELERGAESVKHKVEADPVLSSAETHLLDAIRALRESNEAIKAAIQN